VSRSPSTSYGTTVQPEDVQRMKKDGIV